jgi:hypothetical protein
VRRSLTLLSFGLALVASGCGGGGGGGTAPAGADLAPASAPAYIWVDTDLSSDQIQTAKALLDRFPGKAKLLGLINKELAKKNVSWETDVKPALGPELDWVWLDFKNNGDDVVGFAQPKDKAKLDTLLKAADPPFVSTEINGWTVFAQKQELLSRFRSASSAGSLADDKRFQDEMKRVPEESIARAYVNGAPVMAAAEQALAQSGSVSFKLSDFFTFNSAAAAAEAEKDGVKLEADADVDIALKPDPIANPYEAKLPNELPSGALFYESFSQLDKTVRATLQIVSRAVPNFDQQLGQVESALGLSLEKDVYPTISGESALAVYKGTGTSLPTFEFVLAVKDEAKARKLVSQTNALLVLSGAVQPKKVTVGGVQVDEVPVPGAGFSVIYGVFDHKLVISNARAAFTGLRSKGPKLASDPLYKAAAAAAGMPSKTIGFAYANLRTGLPYTYDFEEQSGTPVPQDVRANSKPLQSALLYSTRDGSHFAVAGFVGIK